MQILIYTICDTYTLHEIMPTVWCVNHHRHNFQLPRHSQCRPTDLSLQVDSCEVRNSSGAGRNRLRC